MSDKKTPTPQPGKAQPAGVKRVSKANERRNPFLEALRRVLQGEDK